jgi:hypothetical protein
MLAIRNLDGLVEKESAPEKAVESSPSERGPKLSHFEARLAAILQDPKTHQDHILYDTDPVPTVSPTLPSSGLRHSRSFYVDSGSRSRMEDEEAAASPRERRRSLP